MPLALPGNALRLKMAAAMDVDTPTGANSGASKKRFEVKKVRMSEGPTFFFCGVFTGHQYPTSLNVSLLTLSAC